MNNLTSNQKNKTLTVLIACFMITMLTPFFGLLIWSIVSLILILYCVFNYTKNTLSKPLLYLTLFFMVAIVYGAIGKGYGLTNGLVLIFLAYYVGTVACVNIKDLTKKQINSLFKLLIILLLYKILGTFFVLLIDPNAVRNWGYLVQLTNATDISQYRNYRYMGMYTYGEGEALSIILPALVSLFLNTKKRPVRICLIVLIIGGLTTQYIATLTTTFLLSVVFCAFVLLRHFFASGMKGGLIKGLGLLAIVVFSFYLIIHNNENDFFLRKMAELEYSYNEGAAVGDVEKRSDLYMQSLEVCARNPILGMGVIPAQYNNYTSQTVSFHTALLDYWGLFGAFTLLFFLCWKGSVQSFLSLLDKKKKRLYSISYISLFFLLLLKGPVSIDVSYIFSTLYISIICMFDYYNRNANDIIEIKAGY